MKRRFISLILIINLSFLISSCGSSPIVQDFTDLKTPEADTMNTLPEAAPVVDLRENVKKILIPTAPGLLTSSNEYVIIDYSNWTEGYFMVDYLGSNEKVKLQIACPNDVTYTYDIVNGYAAFPLTAGDGDYTISVCEHIEDSKYSIAYRDTFTFSGISEFGPYLYPNRYVYFTEDDKTIDLAEELSFDCEDDLSVVTKVYNYIIDNITYDYDKASTVKSGYTTSVDDILLSGTGICLDYAVLMAAMLRSLGIPTRVEVGYVGEEMVYHAWISVYTEEAGWLNGIIRFNGSDWSLVDPTFGASTDSLVLKEFIGSGSNYSVKYVY